MDTLKSVKQKICIDLSIRKVFVAKNEKINANRSALKQIVILFEGIGECGPISDEFVLKFGKVPN